MARSLTASGPKPTAWQRALDEFIIEGVKTTIPMHKKILADEDFTPPPITIISGLKILIRLAMPMPR